MARSPIRFFALFNHFMVWVSAVIVMGIVSYFLSKFGALANRRTHIVYQETIAVLTVAIWTVGMLLPLVGRYGGHMWPVNLIFSYLWLTSFIFSAQDWARQRCYYSDFFGKCSLKKTVIAFNFFAFFFLLINALVEAYMYRSHRAEREGTGTLHHAKRPGTAETAETTHSAAPVAPAARGVAEPATTTV
ncbi:MARVEL-like domain protein [Cordyceps fumosorosea ARSEF 2679]|uniref:MARVEL-like domain protein n=1 Tax=Cordyceps fumosorosea (strain ARSEF 2679) TaxID=1081104 RepID=A0A167TPJ3_CORFA|nr:MARVEL-like domain protein [Cordyceps fumosorosea ARSEF 2679]OAA60813.1 MARVEL-like domain protein [Cordyceps fumosorosea ARSEF 2679]